MSNVLPFRPREKPAAPTGGAEPCCPGLVTIEAGVPLLALYEALKAAGLRFDYSQREQMFIIRGRRP